jgi:transposase-like protein
MISESIRRRGISVGEVSYKGHRYPAQIIAHCVWLYHRFPLSFCEVEELMLVRGVIVSYETIRQWCAKFGPEYACRLRRRQPRPGDKWHLDEVFLTINAVVSICGVPSTGTATSSTSWSNLAGTPRPPSGSSVSC